jgi:alkylation response protein AidB-like acyl-CoA dehydrogenase
MDLTFTPGEDAFRREARAFLEANVPRPALPSGDTAEGFALHVEWEKKLFEAKWAVVSWPKEYGGREASLFEWLIFEEEYYRAGAPARVTQNGIFLLAPTLFEFGTEEQKKRILSRMAGALDLWAQGWSEPEAGSDLAGIKSRAVRDEAQGGFRLTGQKTWCTRGAFCNWLFGLFRTDPAAERHRGLTYFLVPLDAAGVTVRAVGRLDGDPGFAEVFLDDVFVPDRDVLGAVNQGWRVAMATTSSERGLTLRSPGRFTATAARLVDLYRRRRAGADPALRDAVIQAWMDAEAYRLYTLQTVTKVAGGGSLGPESSLNKIFWSELDIAMHETALRLLGPEAELVAGAPEAEGGGQWMKGFQFALAGPIYAGTNEIQRNVVAERLLGLPKDG